MSGEFTRRALMLGGLALAAKAAPAVRFGVRSPLPKLGLRERAMLVKDLGFDGIELGPEWLNQPIEQLQEQLDGTGVAVSAIVGSLGLLNTDPRKRADAVELDRSRLKLAQQLKAGYLIEVPIFGANQFQDLTPVMSPREIEDRLLIAGLKQLAPDAQRTGVTILIEPLTRKETHYMNTQEHGSRILEAVGAPGFQLLSDFYHMQLEERNIGETLGSFGKHTGYVHLADGEKRTEPGSLPFDYRPGFRALKQNRFSGWLTMEANPTDNPRDALARALRYVRAQWDEA